MRSKKSRRRSVVEFLESRRLLSVSAVSLTYPLTPGSKWSTQDNFGTTDDNTVAGTTTFNAHTAIKIQDISSSPGNNSSSSSSYVAIDALKNFVDYGSISVSTDGSDPPVTTTVTETITPAAIIFPTTMVAGTVYSFTTQIHASSEASNGTGNTKDAQDDYTLKLVSDTRQSITVLAGTFLCYEIDQVSKFTVGAKTITTTVTHWVDPGLPEIKQVSVDNNNTTTTKVLTSFTGAKTAAQLEFGTQPTDTALNKMVFPAVTVQVEDSSRGIVGDNTSTVTIAEASGPAGGLTGTLAVAAAGGTASFSNLKFTKPGTYTLRATDGALTAAVSQSFVVGSKLVFGVQPYQATSGANIAPAITVKVEDPNGHEIPDSSNITLAVKTGPVGGVLAGTVTVQAVSGVATFGNVNLNIPGIYTLEATSGLYTPGVSSSFTVLAKATASKLAFKVQPGNTVAGKAIAPAVLVAVEFPGGATVTSDASTVTLAVATGPGKLGGTLTAKAVNGIATFSNLILTKAGTYTLKATDGALTAAISAGFKVIAAAATKLVFAAAPKNAIAGKAISPALTVDIEDQFGNIATTNTSSVTMALGSGKGKLGGTTAAVAKAGVATFANLLITKVGAFTLKATDGLLSAVTSASFKISPAAAAKLVIATQPATTVAGKAIAPAIVVDVDDAFGNIVTTNASSVSLAVATGGGALTGTATVAATAGVATFSNVILTKAGAHTLKATDAALTPATSKSFTIAPDVASKLVLAKPIPASDIAGQAISPAVVVDVEDQFNNIVTTNVSNVTMTILTGPKGAKLTGTATVAAKAGVATFSNLLLTKAGSYTLKASDAVLTIAKSAAFTVHPAAASKLVFLQAPSPAAVNAAIAPAVRVAVEDAFGNIVTTDASTMTIEIATGPTGAALGGTTAITAVKGIASFADLMLSLAGPYTLKVTDGSLTTATSGSFAIT